jgi:hypothetical protein
MAAKTQFFNALVADAMGNVDGSEPFSFTVNIDGDRAVITQESLEAVCLEMGNMIIPPLLNNNIGGSYDASTTCGITLLNCAAKSAVFI